MPVSDTIKHIPFSVQDGFYVPIVSYFVYCLTKLLIMTIHNVQMSDKLE